jgi:hypothetical protein
MGAGYTSDLFELWKLGSSPIQSGVIIGAYDVGAGNMLLVDVRTDIHLLATQPTEWGFFIRWDGSPRKNKSPPDDPGPGYRGPNVPRGQYFSPPILFLSLGGSGGGQLGPLIPKSYSVAPPAGVESYDWNYPLFRFPCNANPGPPTYPWTTDTSTPPLGWKANDFLFLIPAPMDYAQLVWYVNPSPFTPAGISPPAYLSISAAAVVGCPGFSMPQKP